MTTGSTHAPYDWLIDALQPGTEIVTASRRLARELAEHYGRKQLEAGRLAWRTPPIRAFQDWVPAMLGEASDLPDRPVQIDPLSSSVLWEQCLQQAAPEGLLGFRGVVRQALSAWQSMNDWAISPDAVSSAARSQDEQFFASAMRDYRQRLGRRGWSDAAAAPALLGQVFRETPSLAPRRLVLAGYDRLPPTMASLCEALRAAGTDVVLPPARSEQPSVSLGAFESEAAELRSAGAWARRLLEDDPELRIAILCPTLETGSASRARLVREGLVPGWQFGTGQHRTAVNVSFGRRLIDYPPIAIALMLLRWAIRGARGREISLLLRSRHIVSADLAGRSRLELNLRKLPDREWRPQDLAEVLSRQAESGDARAFVAFLEHLVAFRANSGTRATPAEWAERIDALLNQAQWPGTEPQDSTAFQLINRWRQLLNDFTKAALVTPEISLRAAVSRIDMLATEAVWQPDAGPGTVQLLGMLDAAGLEFDRTWVTGMDAAQWPPRWRPSTLLPISLQQDADMPQATPENAVDDARRLLSRIVGSTGECVLSYSHVQDDAEMAVSGLVSQVCSPAPHEPDDPGWAVASLAVAQPMSSIDNDDAPPVADGEVVSGGAYTLQRQFVEPFTAFASGRLGIRRPEAFRKGLTPAIRGDIIHNALHNLLAGHPDQATLAGWSDAERDKRIGTAIDSALAPHIRNADQALARIIGIERQRLRTLLADFLDAEELRPSFSVAGVEQIAEYRKHGVALRFRIDRIDQLDDGGLIIIDYKTGRPKNFVRQDGDLREVQLVAYASALDGEIAGLVYINVDSREISYRGTGGGWRETSDDDWVDTLASWRALVDDALSELAGGDARIDSNQSAADGRVFGPLSRLEAYRRGR